MKVTITRPCQVEDANGKLANRAIGDIVDVKKSDRNILVGAGKAVDGEVKVESAKKPEGKK